MVQYIELYLQWRTNRKSHMVYRTAPFSMTLTPNPRVMVMVRIRVSKVRKPYPNFQMVPLSMTLSDLWSTFQGHDNIQRPITPLIVSRVWSVQWFRFQWPWVTLNVDFKVTETPSTNCAQLTRDLFAIAKFLSCIYMIVFYNQFCSYISLAVAGPLGLEHLHRRLVWQVTATCRL